MVSGKGYEVWIRGWLCGFAFLIAALVSAAGGAAWDPDREIFYSPFPAERITGVSGKIRRDSQPLSGGSTLIVLSDPVFTDREGNQAGSGGKLVVILASEKFFYRGMTLDLSGTHKDNQDGTGIFFSRDKKTVGRWEIKNSDFWRGRFLEALDSRFFFLDGDTAGMLKALTLGFRDNLDEVLYEDFKKAGVLHILALSGMHLGLLTGLLAFLLVPVLGKKNAQPVILLFLLFYLYLTGFKVSLFRAAAMYFLYGLSTALGRKTSPLRILALVFLVSLVITPSGISSAGFELSFAALGGIFLAGIPLAKGPLRRLPALVAYPLGVSLGAQAATIPILLIHFGLFSPGGLLCGLVLTPLITIFLYLGIFFMAAGSVFSFIFTRLYAEGLDSLYTWIANVVSAFAALPVWIPGKGIARGTAGAFMVFWLIWIIRESLKTAYGKDKLRFTPVSGAVSGGTGASYEQAFRTEFSDQPGSQGQDH